MNQYKYEVSEGAIEESGTIDGYSERDAIQKLTKKFGVSSWSVYLWKIN